MKILLVQDYLRRGGTERQALGLARAFAGAGHAASLLTFRPGGPLAPGRGGLDHRSLQTWDLGLDWLAPGLRRAIAAARADVVLCLGRMANCYAGRIQAALPSAAVVATLRTGRPLPWLFRRSLRRVRHIVANSRESRDILVARHGVPPEKVTVIPNSLAFPAAAAPGARESTRARIGAGPQTEVLLSVALFRREKNQRELVEIAAGLPAGADWQLWLAGDGPARRPCERLARRRRLGDRVRFLGWTDDPSPLYAAADVAVHASGRESLSNFTIEAQAHGLPAVVYPAQGIAECFLPGHTGWVVPWGDRPAFRAVLLDLMREPPEARIARSHLAASFARAAFDPDRRTAEYLDLFRRLAEREAEGRQSPAAP